MTPFDQLIRLEVGSFVLEAVRLAGMVMVAPLAWSAAPARVKAALVLLLTLGVHGQGSSALSPSTSLFELALAVGSELLLGAAIGFVAHLAVAAVEIAAESVALSMGLGVAQVFDPQTQAPHNVLTSLLKYLALFIALGLGLHRVLIAAVVASFHALPVGSLVGIAGYAPTFVELGAETLATGLRLSLPILAVLFMTQVGLAFISRAAPAIQIFSIGFGVTLGVGALVLGLGLPDLAREMAGNFSRVPGRIETLLLELSADVR